MYSDALILRTVVQSGLTTKGSELTAEELDGNFIALWQDLKQRLSAGNLDPYSSVKAYAEGDAVSYADNTWLNVSPTGSTGTEPGSDEDVWLSIPVEQLAHQRNKDTKLDEGGDFEVSAEDIRALIDGGGGNFFTADLTATADRTHSAAGFGVTVGGLAHWWLNASAYAPTLGRASFEKRGYGSTSGDVVIREENGVGAVIREVYGDKSVRYYGSTGYNTVPNANGYVMVDSAGAGVAGILVSGTSVPGVRSDVTGASAFVGNGQIAFNGNGTTYGVYGYSENGFGVFGNSNANGYGGYFRSADGLASLHIGRVIVEPTESGVYDASVMFEVRSTTKGALLPRMTTAQILAIPAPADGLIVYNLTISHLCVYLAGTWSKLSHSPM